jgi:hypothetical protein
VCFFSQLGEGQIKERNVRFRRRFPSYQRLYYKQKYCKTLMINRCLKNSILYCSLSGIFKLIFIICACLVIFFYFLQSDWLQQRAAFYDILTVVQKSYFFAKTEEWRQFSNSKHYPKSLKIHPIDIKIVKYSELASVDLVPRPKCTFLRQNCEKKIYKRRKTLASATCFIQMFHLYSAILQKYTYKYK